jgi:hypothetical protein
MSSVIQGLRVSKADPNILGGWGSLVAGLVVFHLIALIVWILLWISQSARGDSKPPKQDKKD